MSRYEIDETLRMKNVKLSSIEISKVKPEWWFRPISDAIHHLTSEPITIEYLKMWTGETFIHTGGTAFWDSREKELKLDSLMHCGVTHYRLVKL